MSLLSELKNNKNSRKIFGKRELKIIEKQLQGVNLTQSEKNRLSRDIRKKLDFIKEINKYSHEFELKKGSEIKKIVNDALETIKEHNDFKKIKRIILFGSAVENKLTFRSDIDLAVEFDDITLTEATKFRINILGRVSNKVDLQVYNTLPDKIKEDIDKKGKVLFQK